MPLMFYTSRRSAAERVVLACGLPAILAAACSANAPGDRDLAETLRAADAVAGGGTGGAAAGESACLLQSQASAAKAYKRAPGAADDAAAEGFLELTHRTNGSIDVAGNVTSPQGSATQLFSSTGLLDTILAELGLTESKADQEVDVADGKPKKSKVVLMILEMVPLCGPLGIDRFYIGSTKTAIAKLIVCVCTCLVGGLVWGLLDAIVVIVNSLTRKSSIDSLGMVAEFSENDIEPAHTLAVIGVMVQIFFCCGGPRLLSFIHARIMGRKEPAQATAIPANGPAAAILTGR